MAKAKDPSPEKQPSPTLPEGIAPPPPIMDLPKPDGLEEPNQQSRVNKEKKKRKKRSKERRHPKDPYEPLGSARGHRGCLIVLLLFPLALALAAGWMGWQLREEFVTRRGFDWINVRTPNLIAAPETETVYLGAKVAYEAPETPVEIVFAGGLWWLGGTFEEKIHFRGLRLCLEPDTQFLKGLHVDALFFDAGDAEIQGEITGRILKRE